MVIAVAFPLIIGVLYFKNLKFIFKEYNYIIEEQNFENIVYTKGIPGD